MWPAPPQKVQFAALALDPEGWAAVCDRVSRPGMLRALLAVVQEGDDNSANLVCRQYGSLCKAAACIHERRASCQCQYGLRGMLKKMRVEGQVRVMTNQGHARMQHKNSQNLR